MYLILLNCVLKNKDSKLYVYFTIVKKKTGEESVRCSFFSGGLAMEKREKELTGEENWNLLSTS